MAQKLKFALKVNMSLSGNNSMCCREYGVKKINEKSLTQIGE